VLVLTELVQNAVEHAFADGSAGTVVVSAGRERGRLAVRVCDDGVGLPEGFSMTGSDRLGLQIVRTLTSADLAASFELRPRENGVRGTEAVLSVPMHRSAEDGS
jgi:two-component system, sensor histidine kinase PdtaS